MKTSGFVVALAGVALTLTAGIAATSTGTLGAFTAIISNQANAIDGTNLSFTQTVIDDYSTTGTQVPGTVIRTSNGTGNGQYTALDVPVFPPLSTATDLQPVTVVLRLENTGNTNAIITARYENLTFTKTGAPLPGGLDAALVAEVMNVGIDGKVSESGQLKHTTTATASLGALAAGQAVPFIDPVDSSPLVIAPGENVVVQLTHTVNTVALAALGSAYSGVGGSVDVVFEMNQTAAEPTTAS